MAEEKRWQNPTIPTTKKNAQEERIVSSSNGFFTGRKL